MNQPPVIEANTIHHQEFAVTFADGLTGAVKILPSHLYGVFEKLKDPVFFHQLTVTEGFIAWPDEIDLAPDAMYQAIKQNGEWVLE
jgi:hypothetical protein